jgi:hypothetical protein
MDWMDGHETVVKRQPCHLEQLGWWGSCRMDGFIDWLLRSQSLIDISAVHTLRLRLKDVDDDPLYRHNVLRLLRTLGASLEHLKVPLLDKGSPTS